MIHHRCSPSNRVFAVSVAFVLLCAVCTLASAQQAPAAPPAAAPAPKIAVTQADNAQLAWEIEAKTVAKELSLDDKKTQQLVDAYKKARTDYTTAAREKLGEGGTPDRQNYQAVREVAIAERAKLGAALKEFLSDEQVAKAMPALGAFNRRWDQMVMALNKMNLEPKVKDQAMTLVMNFVATTGEAVREAGPGADFEAIREKSRAEREKLDAELSKILTPEQMTQWSADTARRRGRTSS